jgi:hypothetical protein
MGSVAVVVTEVFGNDRLQVATAEDQRAVKALTPHRADEALGERVGPGRSDRRSNDLDALRAKDLVEVLGELRIAVPDEESESVESRCEIACLLGRG